MSLMPGFGAKGRWIKLGQGAAPTGAAVCSYGGKCSDDQAHSSIGPLHPSSRYLIISYSRIHGYIREIDNMPYSKLTKAISCYILYTVNRYQKHPK
ncbi:hypothetical protein J2S03_001479 [Alicyclobacillus cycloheptanicus]|uniref:Uncharacterized protein n=1 Tax=Alicyclobacillus cycloheptanicus TaxID=1457 RepID=A0ABT9XHY0_9BACL|nr:hypothetical protein [Alicyclobacillus cycloheptanicus]